MKRTGNSMLVTGGGTGIEQALAYQWHDMGNNVIITGRRQEILEEAIAGRERMAAHIADVTDADGVEAVVRQILAEHPRHRVFI
ncbi:short-subunit dehydrogenase involved in D-alanine esterification of teichoic acids [Paraburkholderia youngii]|uniref:SDR family NAD(P)-dependent oxidoreductase n=1 Tax=Paraburkholderia youngii TaxID=2782701 RepID=UPI003D2124E5